MSFDVSRLPFDPWNDFLGVIMQQGRVQLDSEWNEWLAEIAHRCQAGTMDTLGRAVVPSITPNAFRIHAFTDSAGQRHITIGAGRMYVDGLLVENHGPAASIGYPAAAGAAIPNWASKSNIAVGNLIVDSNGNIQQCTAGGQSGPNAPTWSTVVGQPAHDGGVTWNLVTQWDPALAELSSTPAVSPMAVPPTPTEVDIDFTQQPYLPGASLPDSNGPFLSYLDVWQRPVTYLEYPNLVEKAVGFDTTARLQTVWQVKLLPLRSSTVTCQTPDPSIPEWQNLIQPSSSRLSTNVVPVPTSEPCCLTPGTGYTGMENQLYRVEIHQSGGAQLPGGASPPATFKWSHDNASVITAVTAINARSNSGGTPASQLTVVNTGKDDIRSFKPGDWIEITDDDLDLNGQAGELHRIDTNGVDKSQNTILLQDTVSNDLVNRLKDTTRNYHTRITRWDQKGKVLQSDGATLWVDLDQPGSTGQIPVPPSGTSLILENGITVSFDLSSSQGSNPPQFRIRDFWAFAARATDGTVEQFTRVPPMGIYHHYARLSVVTFPDNATDCRVPWPPPASTGADCSCTVCINLDEFKPDSIAQAIEKVKITGGTICFGPGIFRLSSTLHLQNLGNNSGAVTIRGQGFATILAFSGEGPAINATGNENLRIHDLAIIATTADLATNAAIVVNNCIDTAIERCAIFAIAPSQVRNPQPVGIRLQNSAETTIERCAIATSVQAPQTRSILNSLRTIVSGISTAANSPGAAILASSVGTAIMLDAGVVTETLIRGNVLIGEIGLQAIASADSNSAHALENLELVDNLLLCSSMGAAILQGDLLVGLAGEITFRTNRAFGCADAGIAVHGTSLLNAAITIKGNYLNVFGTGILGVADHLEITDNVIAGANTSGPAPTSVTSGITVGKGTTPSVSQLRILRNQISSQSGPGIQVSSILSCSIAENSITNVNGAGIIVVGPGAATPSEVMVRNNEIFSVLPLSLNTFESGFAPSVDSGGQPIPRRIPGMDIASIGPDTEVAFGIYVRNATVTTIANNTVALLGNSRTVLVIAVQIEDVSTVGVIGNDMSNLGPARIAFGIAVDWARGFIVPEVAEANISANVIRQSTFVASQALESFWGILVFGGEPVPLLGQVIVSSNLIAGGPSALGRLIATLVVDCTLTSNNCAQPLTNSGALLTSVPPTVQVITKTAIASNNRIQCFNQQTGLEISTQPVKQATVVGNIVSTSILLDNQVLLASSAPWGPLNIIA